MTNTRSTGPRRRILSLKLPDDQKTGSTSDRSTSGTPSDPVRADPLNNPSVSLRRKSRGPEEDNHPPETTPDDTHKRKQKRGKPLPLTPEQMRTFHPDQRAELLARFCKALAVTEDELPAFLTQPVAIPLKIGAANDLAKRFALPEDQKAPERRKLSAALNRYCWSSQYQHAILNSGTRFTIDMEPDAPVTEAHRENAIKRLGEFAKRRKARREKQEQEQKE